MRERNVFIGILIVIIVVLFVVISVKVTPPKDYLFIDSGNVYFGMTKNLLMNANGKPAESNKNISDTSTDEYVYLKEILGQSVEIRYYLHNARLVEAYIIAEDISYDLAISIAKKIINEQKNYYSLRQGYYHSELETDGTTKFIVSNGISNGAIGISFDFEYTSRKLTISAISQK